MLPLESISANPLLSQLRKAQSQMLGKRFKVFSSIRIGAYELPTWNLFSFPQDYATTPLL